MSTNQQASNAFLFEMKLEPRENIFNVDFNKYLFVFENNVNPGIYIKLESCKSGCF